MRSICALPSTTAASTSTSRMPPGRRFAFTQTDGRSPRNLRCASAGRGGCWRYRLPLRAGRLRTCGLSSTSPIPNGRCSSAGWSVRSGPRSYSVLLVHGEQGSAKSTLVRVCRSLLDPNEAPVRREPRDGRDLIIAALNGHVVAFDNVSKLTSGLSDDLARLATGSGFGARQLFTDLDEVIVHVARPISLNGISEFAVRGDMLDRALVLTLPPINRYRDEDEFWEEFAFVHPWILGALFDVVSMALRNHESTPTPNVRMADFARWVQSAEPALGIGEGAFVRAYLANRSDSVQLILEADLLTAPVAQLRRRRL